MTFSIKANKVVQSPRDMITDAVVIAVEKTTWRNIIDPEKLVKFDNPDEEIINITYELKYLENVLRNSETYKFYENPMSNSNLGKFLTKYGDLQVGLAIKVYFDDKSIPKITLPN